MYIDLKNFINKLNYKWCMRTTKTKQRGVTKMNKKININFTEEEHVYLKWIMLKQIENIKKAINEENKKETKKDNTKILFMQKGLSDSRDIFEKIVMSKIGGL